MTMLNRDFATLGSRLAAQFIDSFIAILILLVSLAFARSSSKIGETLGFLGILTAVLYILCSDGLEGGQSYGKKMMGIVVIDATSGRPCTFVQSLGRNISLSLLGLIDWIFIFSERRQRLGDLIAHTIVVKKRAGYSR